MASSILWYKLDLNEHAERCKTLYFVFAHQLFLLIDSMVLSLDSWRGKPLPFCCLQEKSDAEGLAVFLLNSRAIFSKL